MRRFEPIRLYMTPAPYTVTGDVLLAHALDSMKVHDVQHLPVMDADQAQLIGMLSSRDVLLAAALLGEDAATTRVSAVMSAPVYTCGPEAQLSAVAKEMLRHRCGSTVVVRRDAPTTVLGIFTMTDVLRLLAGMKEDVTIASSA